MLKILLKKMNHKQNPTEEFETKHVPEKSIIFIVDQEGKNWIGIHQIHIEFVNKLTNTANQAYKQLQAGQKLDVKIPTITGNDTLNDIAKDFIEKIPAHKIFRIKNRQRFGFNIATIEDNKGEVFLKIPDCYLSVDTEIRDALQEEYNKGTQEDTKRQYNVTILPEEHGPGTTEKICIDNFKNTIFSHTGEKQCFLSGSFNKKRLKDLNKIKNAFEKANQAGRDDNNDQDMILKAFKV